MAPACCILCPRNGCHGDPRVCDDVTLLPQAPIIADVPAPTTGVLQCMDTTALGEVAQHMVFIGLSGMIDPVREEVLPALQECRTAGIRVVMITGDHIDTATAIAKELGILTDPSQAILGQKLNTMTVEELDRTIEHYTVYARVQPEHKVRIVNAWKRKGMVVAMNCIRHRRHFPLPGSQIRFSLRCSFLLLLL